MELRPAQLNDIDEIKRIANQTKNTWLGFTPQVAWQNAILRNNFMVAEGETELLGYTYWQWRKRDKIFVLRQIAVDKIAYRRGVGKALLKCVPRPLILYVIAENPANLFYQSEGLFLIGSKQGKKHKINIWQSLD